MKTSHFLSLAAFFALALTFFACSSDSDPSPPPDGESSGDAAKLCGNVEYDANIFRCEYGELIGKCNGADFRPAYQVCNEGRIEDKNPLSSSQNGTDVSSSSNTFNDDSSSSASSQNGTDVSSSSSLSIGGSSSSIVIPKAFEFLGGGYNVISSAYINPVDATKHKSYPVLDREKMFQDGLFDNTDRAIENFETVASNSIKETYHKRNLKIGVSAEASLPSLPFFSGGASGEYENVTNSSRKAYMSFVKLNYYNYKKDLSIKSATKEKLKDYLTNAFKNDLKAKSAAQIIELYGTHIFVQYYRGGSLEANYTYAYDGQEDVEAVKKSAALTFTGIPGVKVSGDISNSTNASSLAKEENLTFKYYSYGGSTIGAGDLTALKSRFQGWATSIQESNAEICGIAGFTSSLIPIWDLASAGGFSTEANALKTEYNSQAVNKGIAFPSARLYKKDVKTNVTKPITLSYENGTIAEIEIYALGAGGGGQGGDNNNGLVIKDIGTGGAGGGGSASYLKLGNLGLNPEESVSLNVIVGTGGAGGAYYSSGAGGTTASGDTGRNGGTTRVEWVAKNITLTAPGGNGGGGNNKLVTGGPGGTPNSVPNSNYKQDGDSKPGTAGTEGNLSSDVRSAGGASAKITAGSLGSFGGYKGAVRSIGGTWQDGEPGGGGNGGYASNAGKPGKDGLVNIVVYYFWEEGKSEAKPENYGTACNSYCRWDTGCFEIRTDPDGIYGDANTSCSDAITTCDYYGLGRYSNATCTGSSLTLSSAKPQSCNYYCLWDSGCYELKTDPAGLYGTIITSCAAAISNCDDYGARYSNGDCL